MISTSPPPEKLETGTERLAELDGVRGAAAFAIVLWHYIPSITVAGLATPLAYLSRALSLCWAGVDLFFVLSGFLIGTILLRQSASPRYFSTFYARRAARIVPLYVCLLAGLVLGNLWLQHGAPAIVSPVFESKLPWWSYPLFAQNLFMPGIDDYGPKLLSVTWSLAVEEQFYLLLPLLIWVTPRRYLGWVLLATAVSAPVLRAVATPGMGTYVLLPYRLDSLMAGALLAYIWRSASGREWIARHHAWLAGAWIVIALPILPLLKAGAGMRAMHGQYGWCANAWLAVWFALGLALLLNGRTPLSLLFRFAPLCWMGRIAYGLYLLHPVCLWAAHLVVFGSEPVLHDLRTGIVTAAAVGLSLAAAALAYRWIEAPFLAWGKRFKY